MKLFGAKIWIKKQVCSDTNASVSRFFGIIKHTFSSWSKKQSSVGSNSTAAPNQRDVQSGGAAPPRNQQESNKKLDFFIQNVKNTFWKLM